MDERNVKSAHSHYEVIIRITEKGKCIKTITIAGINIQTLYVNEHMRKRPGLLNEILKKYFYMEIHDDERPLLFYRIDTNNITDNNYTTFCVDS